MTSQTLPIRDIKPLLPVPDISIYLFIALVVAGIVAFIALLIYILHWIRGRKRGDPRLDWIATLDRIDYSDPKKAAYTMTRYGRLLAEEKRSREIFSQLLPRLERYKYRKDVSPLDSQTKRLMKLFIEMVHDAL